MHIRKYIIYHNKGHTLNAIQFTLLLTNEPSLPYSRSSKNPCSQSPALLPLTNQTYPDFRPDQPQLIPESYTVDRALLPSSISMVLQGRVNCVRPVLITRPSVLMEMDVQIIVQQERSNPPQNIVALNGQDR